MASLNPKTELTTNERRPQLLTSGGRVSLADWLQVSWFYPRGFKKERIIETDRSYIVLGKSIVYKFPKQIEEKGLPTRSFVSCWQAVCEEVIDNRELAPDLYLGMRLLRWLDDEPYWISEVQGKDILSRLSAENADEVALVMRRIPQAACLSALVADDGEVGEDRVRGLVKMLTKFYEHRTRAGIQACSEETDLSLRWIKTQVLTRLQHFIDDYGSFLDPFSQIAFQEAKVFLSGFFTEHRDLLLRRGRNGKIIDVHGNLTCDNICLEPIGIGARTISIFGRVRPEEGTRFADVLSDIASLVVDLKARGAVRLAREFEHKFFSDNEEIYDAELYRFYLVAVAVLRAEQALREGAGEAAPESTSFLALALRYALGLGGRFLMAIGGPADIVVDDLAVSITEMTDAVYLDSAKIPAASMVSPDLDELVFSNLLVTAKQHLRGNSPVVFVWPLNREEERLQVAALAQSLEIPYLLVKCCLSFPEKVNRSFLHPAAAQQNRLRCHEARRIRAKQQVPWSRNSVGMELNEVYVEPIIAQPDLALLVLKHLAAASNA